jgi:hypothetical protein
MRLRSFIRASPLSASVQSDHRRNFIVSNKGAFRRSNLILFVLVLENQNFIEDEHEDDDEGGYKGSIKKEYRMSNVECRSKVFCLF